ncbi:hypothetical protein [Actinobacillus porcinus]|nr:hypothetical protein [Actinobacillus porcinus]
MAKETVEEILQEIYIKHSRINEIKINTLPSSIADPILTGLEKKLRRMDF